MKGSLKKLITFNQCPKTPFSSQKRSDPKFWTLIESGNFFLEMAAIEGEDRVKFFLKAFAGCGLTTSARDKITSSAAKTSQWLKTSVT